MSISADQPEDFRAAVLELRRSELSELRRAQAWWRRSSVFAALMLGFAVGVWCGSLITVAEFVR